MYPLKHISKQMYMCNMSQAFRSGVRSLFSIYERYTRGNKLLHRSLTWVYMGGSGLNVQPHPQKITRVATYIIQRKKF
jgi:hypothetical protein